MATEAPPADRQHLAVESGTRQAPASTWGHWWPGAVCLGLYLILAIGVFGPSTSLGAGRMAGPLTTLPDQVQQVWFLKWAEYALAHGHNPFFTQWQGYPTGLNTEVTTSMLAIGTVFSPITALFGPVVTWNVVVRLALVLSALSMCLVLRRWVTWWPAAFIGGLLYGFSAYSLSDLGHAFVYFVPLPPLMFLFLYEILVRQRWRPARTGVVLGALCGVQYLVSSELLVSTVLMAAAATVLYLIACRRDLAPKWPYIKTSLVFSLVVGGVLLAYPVGFTLFGPGHLHGAPQQPALLAPLHSDLLSPFVPSSEWLGRNLYRSAIGPALYKSYIEPVGTSGASMYFGIPLAVALVATIIWLRRRGVVLLAGAMLAIAFVMSLGSRLYVDGHNTHIPLPFIVVERLPFLDGLIPDRFALFAALSGAGIAAIGLDEVRRRLKLANRPHWPSVRWRGAGAAGLALGLAATVAIPLVPGSTDESIPSPVPPLFTSGSVTSIPNGSVVLAYPYPQGWLPVPDMYQTVNDALLDQAVSGMRFKLIGGYGWWPVPKATYATPTAPPLAPQSVETFFSASYFGQETPTQKALLSKSNLILDLRKFMDEYRVDTVIVLPLGKHPEVVVAQVSAAIGHPVHSGGVTVWYDVQHRLASASP